MHIGIVCRKCDKTLGPPRPVIQNAQRVARGTLRGGQSAQRNNGAQRVARPAKWPTRNNAQRVARLPTSLKLRKTTASNSAQRVARRCALLFSLRGRATRFWSAQHVACRCSPFSPVARATGNNGALHRKEWPNGAQRVLNHCPHRRASEPAPGPRTGSLNASPHAASGSDGREHHERDPGPQRDGDAAREGWRTDGHRAVDFADEVDQDN